LGQERERETGLVMVEFGSESRRRRGRRRRRWKRRRRRRRRRWRRRRSRRRWRRRSGRTGQAKRHERKRRVEVLGQERERETGLLGDVTVASLVNDVTSGKVVVEACLICFDHYRFSSRGGQKSSMHYCMLNILFDDVSRFLFYLFFPQFNT
jgi:hypothetical protein